MNEIEAQRRKATTEARSPENLARLRAETGQRFGSDGIPITLRGVSFAYPDGTRILKSVDMSIPQGKIIAVVGPQHGGKTTFMRILGQTLYPSTGEVFVPSHLRILHAVEEPLILQGGLWKNLALQHDFADEAANGRILRICERMGFSAFLMDELRRELQSGRGVNDHGSRWQSRLSSSDRVLIKLARAFIYNAEVLVLVRPTGQLSREMAGNVARLLREMVDNRGLEMPAEEVSSRRPRTVFLSGLRRLEMETVDQVIQVKDKCASVIEISEVPEDQML